MIVKEHKLIEFINDCKCQFAYQDLLDAIRWYSPKPVTRLKHIFMHGRYPAVSIYDKKIHVHRLLAMYYEQRDLERGEYVHHKDNNSLGHFDT